MWIEYWDVPRTFPSLHRGLIFLGRGFRGVRRSVEIGAPLGGGQGVGIHRPQLPDGLGRRAGPPGPRKLLSGQEGGSPTPPPHRSIDGEKNRFLAEFDPKQNVRANGVQFQPQPRRNAESNAPTGHFSGPIEPPARSSHCLLKRGTPPRWSDPRRPERPLAGQVGLSSPLSRDMKNASWDPAVENCRRSAKKG